jgi:hypothetical protein
MEMRYILYKMYTEYTEGYFVSRGRVYKDEGGGGGFRKRGKKGLCFCRAVQDT